MVDFQYNGVIITLRMCNCFGIFKEEKTLPQMKPYISPYSCVLGQTIEQVGFFTAHQHL